MRIATPVFWQKITQVIVCLCVMKTVSGQDPRDFLHPQDPKTAKIKQYPFYNGVQMLEVDNMWQWQMHINYLEQTKPRAMNYASLEPPPSPNVYLFRNSAGVIIKAFNTTHSLAELNAMYQKVPLNASNNNQRQIPIYFHYSRGPLTQQFQTYDDRAYFYFNGFYKVYEMKKLYSGRSRAVNDFTNRAGNLMGLIDSLGNLRINFSYQQIYPAGNNLLVMKNDKWGIIDKNENIIVPLQYEEVVYENEELLMLKQQSKITTLYLIKTTESIPVDDYDELQGIDQQEEKKLIQIKKGGKIGLMGADYKVVTPPIYDICESNYYSQPKLARVAANKKWGYINPATGKVIIPLIYEHAEPFEENSIALVQQEGEWQCIDSLGNSLSPCSLTPVWREKKPIGKNKGWIIKDDRGYYGIMNNDEQVVLPLIYRSIWQGTNEDFLRIFLNDKQCGLADESGKELLPCVYDRINNFSEYGVAIVMKDDLMGLINKRFQLIAPCAYSSFLYTNHQLLVFSKNGKYGAMDSKGKTVITAVYDHLWTFNEAGYAQAMKDSLYGIIDLQQQEIVPIKYKTLSSEFINNRVWFGQNKKIGFLAAGGAVAIPAVYDYANNFDQPITSVRKGENWAFIDTSGNQRTDFIYDFVDHFWMGFKYCRVRKAGKWGIIDTNATEILPCIYDEINGYSGKYGFPVKKGGEKFNINPAGERVRRD
jgi:WG containing repeat